MTNQYLTLGALAALLTACGGGGGTGGATSQPNRPPTADAGPGRTASLRTSGVALTAAGSFDPDGDSLSYRWTISTQPSGAAATIRDGNTRSALLLTSTPGTYVIDLAVSDGRGGTSTDSVTLELTNEAPEAGGALQTAGLALNDEFLLDATASTDVNEQGLTY
ncbi:PKD domain-containing protein [Parvularcula sp. LCG005]|uniref:PKD domain-containing protein n=1 Tax=Parvularcula sp. LCG005 TaxID=3078805 RepID=UPI0029428348|nr:Ig-like domain-containing protein [Parvularcula sp. LCG005]WOI52972.1 Ig-like domain-containing protein [Parvularcula sp. LCG005]